MKYDKENRLEIEHEKKEVREMIKLINVDKNKIAIHDKEHMESVVDIYSKYGIVKNYSNMQDIYTNEFIPE